MCVGLSGRSQPRAVVVRTLKIIASTPAAPERAPGRPEHGFIRRYFVRR